MSAYIFGWDNDMGLKLIYDIMEGRKTATSSFRTYFKLNPAEESPWERLGKIVDVKDKYGKTYCKVRVEKVYTWVLNNPPIDLVRKENFGNDIKAYIKDCKEMWLCDIQGDIPISDDEALIAEEFTLI